MSANVLALSILRKENDSEVKSFPLGIRVKQIKINFIIIHYNGL